MNSIVILCDYMQYMFIDESGDLGSQSKNLIFSALLVRDEAPLKRIIKNMRRNKFKKELKKANEIKGNKSSPELVKYMIRQLNGIEGAKVFYITLEKEKCYSIYLNDNKHKLYNYVAGWMAKNIILEEYDVVIRIDRSKTKQVLRDDFDRYFREKLKENCSLRKVEIYHSYSHSWAGLQFADILSWAAFQKVERKNNEFINELTIDKEVYSVW